MSRTLETMKARWVVVLLPVLVLTLAGFTCRPAGAIDLLNLELSEHRDVDYQILPTSYHGNCDCPPPCNPCQPESASATGTTNGEPSTANNNLDESLTSSREIAGGQVAYRGNPRLPGYIDDAFIRSRVRVRYDNMQDSNKPTRAEFQYPTLGVWGGPGPPGFGFAGNGGSGAGVNFQELSTYAEVAFSNCFSVFGDFPVRWVDSVDFASVSVNSGFSDGVQAGAGDFRAGVRYGLIALPEEALTYQVRAWVPTGNSRQALGVGHSSIDMSLLYSVRESQRTSFFAEIQDWQTIDAGTAVEPNFNNPNLPPFAETDLTANVLRYGLGFGYDIYQSCDCRPQTLTALFEVVGWTVLEGVTTISDLSAAAGGGINNQIFFTDAQGDTIVNGKYGLRYNWGCTKCGSESVYVGYGHNWTEERWYRDVFRLEYTHFF